MKDPASISRSTMVARSPCRGMLWGIAFLVSTSHVKAQFNVYHPFPDSNAVWGMSAGCTDWNCGAGNLIQNYYAGDTIMDGHTYKMIHESIGGYYGGCSCGVPEDLGAGYLREDTAGRKVYWRGPGVAMDTLLYDFTLEVGDTLGGLMGNIGLCAEDIRTVQSIDSVQVDGSYRKRINFSDPDPCGQTSIIEGVGSTNGLTACYVMPASFGITLTCFAVNGEVVYMNPCSAPDATACGELPLGMQATGQFREPDVAALPNPSSGHFTLAANALSITIYDVPGKQLFQTTGHEIDLTAYPQGIYTAVVQTVKGRSVLRLVVVR